MKKTIVLILIAILVLSCTAETQPSGAQLIINGVSAAFFAEDGSYHPLVESDGIVYAPAEKLGEYLSLDLNVDAEKKIVCISGIPAAFLTDEGVYLPPISVDGVIYVPVECFAKAAGISCTVDGKAIRLDKAAAPATPVPTVTPEPTIQPTPVPAYGYVVVDKDNFNQFFDLSLDVDSDEQDYRRSSFSVYFTITITPRYGFTAENMTVRVSVGSYGSISFPLNLTGKTVKTVKADTVYKSSYSQTDYIWAQANAKTRALFASASVDSISGKLKMSWAEAEQFNGSDYERALNYIKNKNYSRAVTVLTRLTGVNYRDSADLLKQAKTAQKEEEARKAEEKAAQQKADYDAAVKAIANGKPEEAKKLLTALAKDKYGDSQAQLEKAEEMINANSYAEAEKLLENGEFDKAIEQFTALGDYSDSALRVNEIKFFMAKTLEQEGKTDEALAAYDAIENYVPAREAADSLRYSIADENCRQGKLTEALEQFAALGTYSDSAERVPAIRCTLAEQYAAAGDWGSASENYALASGYGDAEAKSHYYLGKKEEQNGNIDAAVANYKLACPIFDSGLKAALLPFQYADKVSNIDGGMIVICNKQGWYGAFDLYGNLKVPFKYKHISNFSEEGIAVAFVETSKDKGYYIYIDRDGKQLFNRKFKEAYSFNDGRAICVEYDESQPCIIDTNGKYIKINGDKLYFQYAPESLSSCIPSCYNDGFAVIQYREKNSPGCFALIDADGKIITKLKMNSAGSELLSGRPSLKDVYYLNTSNKHYISGNHERYGTADGVFIMERKTDKGGVRVTSGYCLYNKSGTVIIPYGRYSRIILPKKNGDPLLRVKQTSGSTEKWGYVDIKGNVVIRPQYLTAWDFVCGLAPVKVDENSGYSFIDKRGNAAIPDRYFSTDGFEACGLAKVQPEKDGPEIIINTKGEQVLTGFSACTIPISAGEHIFAAKMNEDGLWHLFTVTGEDVTEALLLGNINYEELFPEPEDTSLGTVTVMAGTVVRSDKDFNSASAGSVGSEAVYKYYEFDGAWYLIELEDGTQGYVYSTRCK